MNNRFLAPIRKRTPGLRLLLLLLTAAAILLPAPHTAVAAVAVWDTMASFTDAIDLTTRGHWTRVPGDLLSLETDPLKAMSDPAYYGRDYVFSGDIVVENDRYTAVFQASTGRVLLYSGQDPISNGSQGTAVDDNPTVELTPLPTAATQTSMQTRRLLHNAGDQAVLEIGYSEDPSLTAVFAFDKSEIIGVTPSASLKGMRLTSRLSHGIASDFLADDLIYSAADFAPGTAAAVPAEHLLIGLIQGGNRELVLTWPDGNQKATLQFAGADKPTDRMIESIDLRTDSRSFHLAVLEARGIWHEEPLKAAFLEKQVPATWKPPFPAKWVTQLPEARVATTFAFRTSKSQIWRGVPGMYQYPVWLEDGVPFFHLSKKIPPKGRSLIYFLEGQDTPSTVTTPVDVLSNSLGRSAAKDILDIRGRHLRSHHRRGADGVRRACTCGATEAIQSIFEAGTESKQTAEIAEALEDMQYFVEKHVERIEEYQRFAAELSRFLTTAKTATPAMRDYLEQLEPIVARIPEEYSVQKENMKSLEHAQVLAQQTQTLASRKGANNLQAYMELLKAWRAMGGAQDYVLAQCHTIARNLHQQAGYAAAAHPEAIDLAREIRNRCRQILRNPDGYEIWANY